MHRRLARAVAHPRMKIYSAQLLHSARYAHATLSRPSQRKRHRLSRRLATKPRLKPVELVLHGRVQVVVFKFCLRACNAGAFAAWRCAAHNQLRAPPRAPRARTSSKSASASTSAALPPASSCALITACRDAASTVDCAAVASAAASPSGEPPAASSVAAAPAVAAAACCCYTHRRRQH
jgi:hypothetical protein